MFEKYWWKWKWACGIWIGSENKTFLLNHSDIKLLKSSSMDDFDGTRWTNLKTIKYYYWKIRGRCCVNKSVLLSLAARNIYKHFKKPILFHFLKWPNDTVLRYSVEMLLFYGLRSNTESSSLSHFAIQFHLWYERSFWNMANRTSNIIQRCVTMK